MFSTPTPEAVAGDPLGAATGAGAGAGAEAAARAHMKYLPQVCRLLRCTDALRSCVRLCLYVRYFPLFFFFFFFLSSFSFIFLSSSFFLSSLALKNALS